MSWKCPACGQENDDSNDFCSVCLVERPKVEKSSQESGNETTNLPSNLNEASETVSGDELSQKEGNSGEKQKIDSASIQIEANKPTKYFAVFVNSPIQSLVGTKIPLEFDLFQKISLGRGPENVVALMDETVSKKHAELSLQGDTVSITDLNSTNGTFLYDGSSFQRVTSLISLKSGSIIKLGTNTIIRIVTQ